MKGKKQLEIYLQGLKRSDKGVNSLEQYPTDASAAAYVLSIAYADGNIDGMRILDLGSGNGIFSCGAAVLGASYVLGIDIDPEQTRVASMNCGAGNVEFATGSASSVTGTYDTVLMNPPFGSVNAHADMPFLKKAVECANYVYSLHNAKSRDFVRSFYLTNAEIIREEPLNIRIGRLYEHHRKDSVMVESVFFSVRVPR